MSLLEKTKMNASRKSWPISLVIFIVWLSFIVGGGLLQIKGHHIQLERLVEKQIMFGELVEIVFLTGVITYLRWWPQVGWKCPNNFRDLRLLWPPALSLLFILMIVLYANLPSFSVLMIVIINTLMVGINEELMFRGILFYGASSSFGIWRAVWITAIIFVSVHILNSLIIGDFSASILQAFFCRHVWHLDCSFANSSKHNYSGNHNSLVVGLPSISDKFHLGFGITSFLSGAFHLWSLVITKLSTR